MLSRSLARGVCPPSPAPGIQPVVAISGVLAWIMWYLLVSTGIFFSPFLPFGMTGWVLPCASLENLRRQGDGEMLRNLEMGHLHPGNNACPHHGPLFPQGPGVQGDSGGSLTLSQRWWRKWRHLWFTCSYSAGKGHTEGQLPHLKAAHYLIIKKTCCEKNPGSKSRLGYSWAMELVRSRHGNLRFLPSTRRKIIKSYFAKEQRAKHEDSGF